MTKFSSLLAIFFLIVSLVLAQEAPKSLREERREVILFGIDSEISELLTALKSEKDVSLQGELLDLLEGGASVKIQKEIFDYFRDVKREEARSAGEELLSRREELPPDLLVSVLGYLGSIKAALSLEKIEFLLETRNMEVLSAALRYLGTTGSVSSGSHLRELFHSPETSLAIRQEIVLALGEMKDTDSLPFLMDLLEDEGEDEMIRRFACDALGKLGDPRALGAIRWAFDSGDNMLRSYAISSLGRFPGEETKEILLSALRDSFPRVRELAAERLGDLESRKAVDILLYRARRDPEKRVRQASFRSLAKIGGSKANNFLVDFLAGEKNSLDYRILAAQELIKERPSAVVKPALELMEQEWQKEGSILLDRVCRLVSQAEYSGFERLYEKMLQHPSFIIKIYGVRGIQRNRLGSLRSAVQELSKEPHHPQLRKSATAALDDL